MCQSDKFDITPGSLVGQSLGQLPRDGLLPQIGSADGPGHRGGGVHILTPLPLIRLSKLVNLDTDFSTTYSPQSIPDLPGNLSAIQEVKQ